MRTPCNSFPSLGMRSMLAGRRRRCSGVNDSSDANPSGAAYAASVTNRIGGYTASRFQAAFALSSLLGGETSYAHGIAIHLGSDQPVWGVQPSDPMSECQSYLPLEEIARRFADDLCALQPDGSFRLAGYSFAGVLAYETACQLVDRGRQVKLVAVIDTGLSRDSPPTLAGSFGISLAVVRNLPNWVLENILRTEPKGFIAGLTNHLKKLAEARQPRSFIRCSMPWNGNRRHF